MTPFRGLIICCVTLVACTGQPSFRDSDSPPATEQQVDLTRYQGLWYEIARYPNRFEKGCAGVTAEYTLRDDGQIDGVTTCRAGRPDGPVETADGIARIVDEQTNAVLEVKFAPQWVPFAWGDYWILDLAPDYSSVLVGSPDGKYLWILAREPSLPAARLDELRDAAAARGYDPDALVMTAQPPVR